MALGKWTLLALAIGMLTANAFVQGQSIANADTPSFDVVSIKRNTSEKAGSNIVLRPDGGLTMLHVATITLLARAFEPVIPREMIGLPGWASNEYYDIRTTSSLARATPAQRAAMIRSMLADRFKLRSHVQTHQTSVYELVLARSDGRLGPGLIKSDLDCAPILEERKANPTPAAPPDVSDFSAPPAQCTIRSLAASLRDRYGDGNGRLGDLVEGETIMDALASLLRSGVDRPVINKTGLTGTYHIKMNARFILGGRDLSPSDSAQEDQGPSIFTALQQQLGLKLQASQIQMDTLAIDRLDRPTED